MSDDELRDEASDEPRDGEAAGADAGDDAGQPHADEHAASEEALTDEQRAVLLRRQLKRLRVIDVVYEMMIQLVQLGYQKLGLTDETRELRNLADAHVAIEALRRLIEVAADAGEGEAESLRSTLAQMQLNFARAASEEAQAPAEPDSQPRVEGEKEPGDEATDGADKPGD